MELHVMATNRGCCKVGEAIREYGLDEGERDVNEYLVARWTGEGEHSAVGYRTLAEWFNKRILRSVYLEAGRSVSDPRIDADYEALEDTDEAVVEAIADDLRIDGIDADQLLEDFVSRATMRRHLTECLGAEKQRRSATSQWELEKVEHGRAHFRRSVTDAIRSLANKGRLPGGTAADVETPVVLSCPECTARTRLETALSRGYICREHLGEVDGEENDRIAVGKE